VAGSLTEQVISYQKNGMGWEGLVAEIALEVYRFPRRKLGWDEDECSEFFCFFYPKIAGLVRRFVYRGKPFEAFLRVTMKWQLRTFSSRRSYDRLREQVLSDDSFWATEVAEGWGDGDTKDDTSSYGTLRVDPAARRILKIDSNDRICDRVIRRRFLFLVLAGAATITRRMIRRAAQLTGDDPEWLEARIEELRRRLLDRSRRIKELRERRNTHFFRIYCIQEQIGLSPEVTSRRLLARAMAKEQRRLAATLDEISRIPATPTHRDIAEILGVPKGSVDSGLFYLRNALSAL
jgi:hypothetical protein